MLLRSRSELSRESHVGETRAGFDLANPDHLAYLPYCTCRSGLAPRYLKHRCRHRANTRCRLAPTPASCCSDFSGFDCARGSLVGERDGPGTPDS